MLPVASVIARILIPTDFSETAAAAVEYGCELATSIGARVTLLHVFSPGIIATPDAVFAPTPEELRALGLAARARLLSMAEKLSHEGLDIDCLAIDGVARETIDAVARKQNADLIVMGTHGRRGLSHLLVGSVTEKVLRRAPCPVLTIGPASQKVLVTHPLADGI